MIPVLFIVIPLVSGLALFFFKNEKAARSWALFSSMITLVVALLGLTMLNDNNHLQYSVDWLGSLGSSFSVQVDGMGQVLCLLTAISFPIIFIATWNSKYSKANNFFG